MIEIIMMLLWFVFGVVFGLICGMIFFKIRLKKMSSGNLRIDDSDKNEDPYLFLELTTELKNVCNRDYIVFNIKKENYFCEK